MEKYVPDCSRLLSGMTVKNYKELCTLLGQPVLNGNAKKSQLREWERYFEYEKQGQAFYINYVRAAPMPTEKTYKVRNGLYVGYIELLLLEYLTSNEGREVALTKKELYQLLGMANPKFFNRQKRQELVAGKEKGEKEDIYSFYQRTEQKLDSIITSALRSMANRFLIKYYKEYVIAREYTDEHGHSHRDLDYIEDRGTIQKILDLEKRVLDEMGCYSYQGIVLTNRVDQFYSKINYYAHELYGWSQVFSHLRIIYLEDAVKKQLPIQNEKLQKMLTEYKLLGLNNTVISSVNRQAEEIYDDFENWGRDPFKSNRKYDYSSNYVEVQKNLAEYLLRINESEAQALARKIQSGIKK